MNFVSGCRKVAGVVHTVVKALWWVSAAVLFILAMISFVDCVGRYFIGQSLKGAQELVEVGMGIFVYTGIGAVIWQRGGIQVPLITDMLSVRVNYILRAFTDLLSLAILVAMAYMVSTTAASTVLTTAILFIPLAPVYYVAVLGSAVGCIEFIIHICGDIYGAVTCGKAGSGIDPSDPDAEKEVQS